MASAVSYMSIGAATIALFLGIFIVVVRNSVASKEVLATPNIPKEHAVLTAFASARISAPADDVFAVLLKYKDYSKWSCFKNYQWQAEVDEYGTPPVGSKGFFKISVENFREKILPVKLTVLDREKRIIVETTTSYPGWLLGAERVQEVIPTQGHPRLCEYRTWHTSEGIAAYILALVAQEDLSEAQRTIADGLKAYVEKSRAKTAMF